MLLEGEFALDDWRGAGLNVPSAAKRGLYTVHEGLILKGIGALGEADAARLDASLRTWLGVG